MASIGILNLPQTDIITGSDVFIVQQNNTTKQVTFNNLLFNLNNATFAPVVSSHSTEIAFLSTTLYSLSSQNTTEYAYLSNLITNEVNFAFNNLSLTLNPISSIKCTSENVNPGIYIKNTTWVLISQGNFIAGVGHTYENGSPYQNGDKNRNNQYFFPGKSLAAASVPITDLYYISLSSHFVEGGLLYYTNGWEPTNSGGFAENQAVLIKAAAYPGYTFAGLVIYNADGTYFNNNQGNLDPNVFDTTTTSSQSSFYMPPNNLYMIANWHLSGSAIASNYYVSLETNPLNGGFIKYQNGYEPTHNGGFYYNEPVVIVAGAYPGYQLVNFTVNGSGFSQNVDYSKPGEVSFYMPQSFVNVVANFGLAPANTIGEFITPIDNSQIATHAHDFQINLQNTNSTSSYQNGPQAPPAWRLDMNTTFTTLSNATTNTPHNNVMPIYGTYIWMRVA